MAYTYDGTLKKEGNFDACFKNYMVPHIWGSSENL
jgi:hypothetical protein